MKYKDLTQFVSAVLKNPKILMLGTSIVVGSQQIKPATAQNIMNYTAINPTIESKGHHIEALTFGNIKNDFMLNAVGYRYGDEFKNKFAQGKYNLGFQVGTNTVLLNKKPVSDKLYEQINLAMNLSKFLGKEINLSIGFNKKLNNYVLNGFNIAQASKGSTVQASLTSKNKKLAGAGSLSFLNGKLTSYSGVTEVNFTTTNKKPLTAAVGFYSGSSLKAKDMQWQMRGSLLNTGNGKYVFMPSVGFGIDKKLLKNKQINVNAGFLFIKNKNKIVVEGVVNPSNLKESAAFVRYVRKIPHKKAPTVKDKSNLKKPRSNLNIRRK